MILSKSTTNNIRILLSIQVWNQVANQEDRLVFYILRNLLSYQVLIPVWGKIWIQLYNSLYLNKHN
jgi:hypothetical protein